MEKEKDKKKAKDILASRFSFTQNTSILCKCIQTLKTLALLGAEKYVTKTIILEKKKNGQIKDVRSMRMLILFYLIQVIPNIYTRFQNTRQSSP